MPLAGLFARRRFLGLLFPFALLLTAPSLWTGWQFDDYLLRERLESGGSDIAGKINGLFVFMDGVPAHAQAQVDDGVFPWFTLPQGRVAFWRPLSALTHWLDFQFWPNSPWLMHLHSLAWFLALGLAAAAFFLQVEPGPAAALAASLYLLDDARGFAVGWISNRNGLIAAALGVLAVVAHVRWRRDGWRAGALLGPGLLALALLAGESAVGALAYLLAFALFLDSGPRARRLAGLLPCLAVTATWRLLYTASGFGAWGTAYVDPAQEPVRFLAALAARAPILLLGQWAYPPAELFPMLTPPVSTALWIAACALGVGLFYVFWPVLRESKLARFHAAGMALSLIPAASALPANRLLFFAGLGASGLLAAALSRPDLTAGQVRRLARKSLIGLHLIIAPLLLPLTAFSPALLGNIEPALTALPAAPAFAAQTVVFASAPSSFHVSYLPQVRAAASQPVPARIRVLSSSLTAARFTRLDARTLLVESEGGYLTGFETVYRDPAAAPLGPGAIVALAGLTVRIVSSTSAGRPAAAAFQFSVPLDDPSLVWFEWDGQGYQPFRPPAAGASFRLPAAPLVP